MAGNRQQSRFLALVSSYERLKETAEIAANSQNAAQLQYLKTLDSIEAKQQQLQTSMQSLYTSTGIQNFYKTLIDLGNSVVQSFTDIPTILNLPIPALLKFGTTFYNIAMLVTQLYTMMRARMNVQTKVYENAITANLALEAAKRKNIRQEEYQAEIKAAQSAQEQVEQLERNKTNFLKEQNALRQKAQGIFSNKKNIGMVASALGMAATLGATTMSTDTVGQRAGKSVLTGLGGLAQGVGTGLMMGGPAGAVMGILTALPAAIEAVGIAIETTEEKIERYDKAIQDANNKKLISENEFKTLADYNEKLKDLEEHQNDSNEARQEYLTLNAEIAANYPELISGIDAQGNLIVELGTAYKQLAQNKRAAYADDIIKSGETQLQAFNNLDWLMNQFGISAKQLDKQYGTNGLFQNLNGRELKGSQDTAAFMQALSPQLKTDKDIRTWLKSLGTDSRGYLEGSLGSAIDLKQVVNNPRNNGTLLNDMRQIINAKLQEDGTTILDLFTQLPEFSNRSDVLQQIQNIGNYRNDVIEGILTSTIASLRQGLDALYDSNHDTVTGLAGIYMNKQLRTSYDTYAQNTTQTDPSKILKNWAKGENLKDNEEGFQAAYDRIFGTITSQTEQAAFQQLNQHYKNIGDLTQKEFQALVGPRDSRTKKYATQAANVFSDEYTKIQQQANNALKQIGINNIFTDFSANMKNRIAALKNKDNFDVKAFATKFSDSSEETIGQLLGFIESGTTDTISGIENIIKQYAQSKGIDLSKPQSDPFIDLMRQFENAVHINFNTEYQTLAESYTSHLKEFDKALKNATSGMGYEDAVALANQLGVTLGQFQQREGKFYLDDLNIIKNKLMPGQDGLKKVLQKRAEIIEQAFGNNGALLDKYKKDLSDDEFKALDDSEQQIYTAIKAFRQSSQDLTLAGWNAYIDSLQQTYDALDKATQYMIQSNWLSTGNLDKFLKSIKDDSAKNINESELYTKALKGELTGELAQFSQQIIELYQKNTKAVYDAVTNLISGQSVSESVVVTRTNKGLLEKILGEPLDESKIGQVIQIPAENAAKNFDKTLYSLLGDQSYSWKARVEAAGKLWEGAFSSSNFRLDTLKSAINSSFQDLDFATWGALPDSIKTLADYNTTTGKFFISLNQAAQVINAQSLIDEGFTKQEANELIATLHKNTREKDIKTIAVELVKNRESLTEQNIASIATALGQTYDDVIATLQLQRNQDGTYRMNMNSILQLMNQKKGQLDTVLAQMIAEEIDNIIGNVSNIASNQSKGVTSYAEMQKGASRAQQAGFDVDISNLYEWNDTIHGFVLSANGILVEVARAQMEFESLSAENKEARQLLQEQIKSMGRQLANSIDINAFMQAENKNPGSEAAKTLTKGIDDYNSYLRAIGQTTLLNATAISNNLRAGGIDTVNTIKEIAKLQGREVTSDEISTAYRQSAEQLLAASQELTAGVGEIVSDEAAFLINLSKGETQKLANGANLVTRTARDLYIAFNQLYGELEASGAATLEELNNLAAEYYNERQGAKKGQLLDMLSNSAEMTYNQLAEMFTAAGWKFTTDTIDQLGNNISKLNNGRVRINNFKGFADALGINTNSPEYLEAFKSYNDALIKESQFVEKTINDELNNLVKAKPGDLINISGLYTKVGEMLEVELMTAGVQFNNGIVKITEATNLPALIQSIESAAAAQGLILESDVQALIDAVQALFKGLADSITKGIQGTLSKTEAMDLQSSARNLLPGFNGELKFTQTYNGLKLSTDQAIKLYDAMKGVDAVSSHIVFDSLTKQLTKAGEACESMSRAMAEIARLEDKVKQSTGDARKEAEKQLAVYKQIANTQIQNPESYDWMNRDLPDYLKGPENYWNSLGTAFKALNEAAKEAEEGSTKAAHMLDPTDFYNMVNEFNNIAQLSGTEINFLGHKLNGDMTSAAKLIEEGMRTLSNVDGDGVKVDLTKFGANFTSGAEGMAKGVHEGIKAMAESQIEMLDGMIQLLETVVAMEGLKDIAGTDNKIDLTDLFPEFTADTDKLTAYDDVKIWAKKLLDDTANTDLQKALDNIVINGESLRTTLSKLSKGYAFSEKEAKEVQNKLDAFYQMYLSGDYSLQNLIGSIKQVFASSGFEGDVKVGDQTFYISQGYILEQGENGWKVPGVGEFKNQEDAIKAYRLKEKTGATDISKDADGELFTTIDIAGQKVKVSTKLDGIVYNINGKECNTQNEVVEEAYKIYKDQYRNKWLNWKYHGGQKPEDFMKFDEWRVQMNVPVQPSVNVSNEQQVKQKFASATHEQITKIAQALSSGEWSSQLHDLVLPFGIDLQPTADNKLLQADVDKIANLAGIDTKILSLSLATEVVGDNADNVKKILANQPLSATVDLTGNLTNLDGTQNTLTYDEQVSVTLANIKAMATAESINWDGITALINTVPEDKRPTVEAQAKQYIIKALEGNPEYQGFPALLTGLQGLPIPALQATATVMSILWGGGANVTNATGLTQDQINTLAATLDLPDTMLEALATLVQIIDGGVVPEESAELATKLSQLFPDGKYTTNDIKAITLAATAAAVMINGKGVTATGEFDDSYQTTNGIAQVTADIIKLIVSTNASTTTEEGTTFNADNWQGTVDKIYAVAALLEVGLQNGADVNVDGTNIPSNVATTKTIEALRASASVLSVIFQKDPAGKNINVEEVDRVIAELVDQGKIQASDIESIKAIVAGILFKPKDDNMKPQGLDTLIPKDTDGAYNAGKLTVKYQTEVEFTDSAEEAYKALRDQLYTLSQGTNAGLYETWGNTSFVNPQTGVTTFLDQLLDKVVNKGHILTRAEQNILNNYKTAIEAAPEELANNFKQINMTIDALIDENDLNISNQQEQFSILSQTFSQLDPTKLQECATAMSELAESAQKVRDVPWQELVNGVNNINNIETPNEDLATASTIMRTVQASLSVVAAEGDTLAAEIISPDPIQHTIELLADVEDIRKKLQALKQFTINIFSNAKPIAEEQTSTTNANTDNNQQTPEQKAREILAAIDQAINEAKNLFNELTSALSSLKETSTVTATGMQALDDSIDSIPTTKDQAVSSLAMAMDNIPAVAYRIRDLNRQLDKLANKTININFDITFDSSSEVAEVKGNVDGQQMTKGVPTRISLAKGNAHAAGKTLVGELGPELVVSNGRYFLVGENGAQMVSLPNDAIVFNHLQTQNLLKKEHGGGRGKPVTNERNAVARAAGTGNAMASASSALAALKQIRAMWQSMLNASMKDLGALAGQEAGKASTSKSGGSGSDKDPEQQAKAVIEQIERWYNLLRQISKLQKDITYEENLQAKIESDRIANGKAMYTSYKQELNYLDEEIKKNQQLADLQKSWYERKREQLVNSDYGKIFTYDENGQLQYRHGTNLGLDVLEKLTRRDIYGATYGSAQDAATQINYLRGIGFDVDKLKYNDDGSRIEATDEEYADDPMQYYVDLMQNYWDRLDSWKDQLDSIYDSYTDQLNNVLTNETKRNQILQKIVDNQLSVEQDVLHAIESREQRLIDELQDERDALEKSNRDFLDGLSDQLSQEKQMYQNQENEKQLTKMRRQLAILERSGGSGSQIRSLQDQIAAKEQDQYFTAQQQQIAAIQKASDLQIDRMDSQIDLMTKTLEYQKEHGLLWEQVYQIMMATPQQIRQFITENTPDFQSASALDVAEKIRDIDLRINEWVGYRDDESSPDMTNAFYDWNSYAVARQEIYGSNASSDLIREAKAEFDKILNDTGDINRAGAAADAIFRAVLGDKPGVEEVAEVIADTVKEKQEDNSNDNDNNNNKNKNYYDYGNNYNYNRNSSQTMANKNTSTTASKKTSWTFGAYQTEEQKSLMANMDRLQAQIKLAHHYGGTANNNSKVAQLEKQFNLSYAALIPQNKKKYKLFKSGGLVDYTGLAQVDGTPQRPEAFINAEQTQMLRNYLFGGSDSLLSLAQQIVQQMHGTSSGLNTNNITEQSGLNIEKIDVNVNVDRIANDYDVRQIGGKVMDEILAIARKSGTRGLSRR